jgi:hypothetical protein
MSVSQHRPFNGDQPAYEPLAWRGASRNIDGGARVVFTGFARSSEDFLQHTRAAAANAFKTISFRRKTELYYNKTLEDMNIDARELTQTTLDDTEFSREYHSSTDTYPANVPLDNLFSLSDIRYWPHQILLGEQAFFTPNFSPLSWQRDFAARKPSSEAVASGQIESILLIDPEIRRALADDRKLKVRWSSGYVPSWERSKSAMVGAQFAVWDADDQTILKVGHAVAEGVLNVALCTRNLNVRRLGTWAYYPVLTLELTRSSATLRAARRRNLMKGEGRDWRAKCPGLRHLRRHGLSDLVEELIAQGEAALPD